MWNLLINPIFTAAVVFSIWLPAVFQFLPAGTAGRIAALIGLN